MTGPSPFDFGALYHLKSWRRSPPLPEALVASLKIVLQEGGKRARDTEDNIEKARRLGDLSKGSIHRSGVISISFKEEYVKLCKIVDLLISIISRLLPQPWP
jgi:hypothetical protein